MRAGGGGQQRACWEGWWALRALISVITQILLSSAPLFLLHSSGSDSHIHLSSLVHIPIIILWALELILLQSFQYLANCLLTRYRWGEDFPGLQQSMKVPEWCLSKPPHCSATAAQRKTASPSLLSDQKEQTIHVYLDFSSLLKLKPLPLRVYPSDSCRVHTYEGKNTKNKYTPTFNQWAFLIRATEFPLAFQRHSHRRTHTPASPINTSLLSDTQWGIQTWHGPDWSLYHSLHPHAGVKSRKRNTTLSTSNNSI